MSLKHRLARLEAAMAVQRRSSPLPVDIEASERGLRALHADRVQLGLLRALRSLTHRRDMTFEQVIELPDGAAILERLRDHLATGAAACA